MCGKVVRFDPVTLRGHLTDHKIDYTTYVKQHLIESVSVDEINVISEQSKDTPVDIRPVRNVEQEYHESSNGDNVISAESGDSNDVNDSDSFGLSGDDSTVLRDDIKQIHF